MKAALHASWVYIQKKVERAPNHMLRIALVLAIALVLLGLTALQAGQASTAAQAPSAPVLVSASASGRHRICGSVRTNGATSPLRCMNPPERARPIE